ncbi:fructose-1,6-bisphosphatase, partial [Cooperia oncophora]
LDFHFQAISNAVRKAGVAALYGISRKANVLEEEIKDLYVMSKDLFINMITSSFACSGIVSKENDEVIIADEIKRGKYIISFDPLNGSSQIDSTAPMGVIFGVWKKLTDGMTAATKDDFMQPGSSMVAAGYCIYGSSTMVILSTGSGVDGFTLDPSIGEFILTHPKIHLPNKGKIYSINEGNAKNWSAGLAAYIHDRKFPPAGKKVMTQRHVGSLVADIHRTLFYGGIVLYPPTNDAPDGELSLLYECAAMSFIIEQAGGLAKTGKRALLDVIPDNTNQRTPFYAGSKEDVKELLTYINNE